MPQAFLGRIKRGEPPEEVITPNNYREVALKALMRDFEARCAFSMRHTKHVGGEEVMHVDHFDPRKRNDPVQSYDNLFLVSGPCNNAKRAFYPTDEQIKLGIRLLNPCIEMDYGTHLFENSSTGELKSETPTGTFHARRLHLNSGTLKTARLERTEIRAMCAYALEMADHFKDYPTIASKFRMFAQWFEEILPFHIPVIPPPPFSSEQIDVHGDSAPNI
jgi:hypothetical protein